MKEYASRAYADEDLIKAFNKLMDKLNQANQDAVILESEHICNLEDYIAKLNKQNTDYSNELKELRKQLEIANLAVEN